VPIADIDHVSHSFNVPKPSTVRGREPDADQRRNRYNGHERVRQNQQQRMDPRRIRNRWRR
ncbi:MAG: hypothetical protein WBG13_15935, partial [Pseudolabrys sp.]